MSYTPINSVLGVQPIATNSTTQAFALGFQIDAYDPTYGAGSFVYLAGVASTAVGSVVSYNQLTGATTLVAEASHITEPIAVSMSANILTTTYGWYQVRGAAVITRVTGVKTSPGVVLYVSSTAGSLTSAVVTGKQVLNCITINAATVASATTTITAQIAYPATQGEII